MKAINTEMPFVVDASVALSWAFEDQYHPAATLALERTRSDTAIVPSLWLFEVRNSLIINERRGRATGADTAAFLQSLGLLGIMIDYEPDEALILALARQYKLTVYDATYLALAQRETLPLATLDKALRAAARMAGTLLLNGA